MLMLRFAVESFASAYSDPDAKALLQKHWQEIAKAKDLFRLAPDETFYAEADKQGKLLIITARDGTALVGYFVWIVFKHPHYKDVIMAQEDIHFLLKDYRKGLNGYLLIKNAILLGKQHGIQAFTVREKVSHPHPDLWRRLGFQPADTTYILTVRNG